MNSLYSQAAWGGQEIIQHADVITGSFPHTRSPLHFWMFRRQTADSMVRRSPRRFCSYGTVSSPAPGFTAAEIQPSSCLWGGLGLSGPCGVGLLWWPSWHRSCIKLCVTRDAEHTGKGGELGQEWLWGCAHNQDMSLGNWAWVQERLGSPCVSVLVGSELMCAKFHHAHLTFIREYHKDSVLNASRALLAFIHANMKFHSNLWCTSPLPHYLKCGFAIKTACIKLASASLTDIFHVWNQNTSPVTSMARIFFTCSFFVLVLERLRFTLESQATAVLYFLFNTKLLAKWGIVDYFLKKEKWQWRKSFWYTSVNALRVCTGHKSQEKSDKRG